MIQDEETGTWYQHKCRDFKVPLVDYLQDDDNAIGTKTVFDLWPGCRTHVYAFVDYHFMF